MTYVEARSVGRTFSTPNGPVEALRSASLTVQAREFVSIVGPSGCGKSTLLRLVAGLLRPTDGSLAVGGERVAGPRRQTGIMFQDPVLLPWRTVLGNITLPAQIYGLDRRASAERATELLAMVGLAGFEQRRPRELSGGEQQRVAMVRTLLNDPELLLLDEPFGALDAMTREQLNADLQRIWLEARKTVVLVTHSIHEAVYLSDRIAVMSRRPGTITDVIGVPLARPRTTELMETVEFAELVGRTRRALDHGTGPRAGPADAPRQAGASAPTVRQHQ